MTTVDGNFAAVPLASNPEPRRKRPAWGWIVSVLLHAIALMLAFAVLKPQLPGADRLHVVPVMIVTSGGESDAPHSGINAAPLKAATITPQKRVATVRTPVRAGVGPKPAPTDAMEAKLNKLARLAQPQSGSVAAAHNFGATEPGEGGEGEGQLGAYGVRDLVRAQVLRRWSLDLTTLGARNFSIAIRVELTNRGEVLKASVVDLARYQTDPIFHEVALSAKNAVILSSPLTLPEGRYADRFAVTVLLNPRETQQ
jgi:hypothetical protein